MDTERRPPVIDMTPDGTFAPMPSSRPRGTAMLTPGGSLLMFGIGALALATLTFWLAILLVPVALVAALVGWGVLRFQMKGNVRRF